MTEKTHVYQPLRNAFPSVHWCRLENLLGSGMADVNGCNPHGVSCWVETKLIKGNQITFQRFQPAWLMKRAEYKDRVFVFARKDERFYLWAGKQLLALLKQVEPRNQGKVLVVDYRASEASYSAESSLLWSPLYKCLFSHPMEAF